jgi:glycosyltransferase involved in cell wall biosynthesis
MAEAISDVAKRKSFDVIHLDSIHLAGYLPLLRKTLPRARCVLDWHNIESELMGRYAESTPSAARKFYAKLTARQMRGLENSMLRSCYGHVVCSAREREALQRRNSAGRIALAPNGVDTGYFSPHNGAGARNRLIFVGQMSYQPNADAVTWFVREVWPGIQARYSAFDLSIVGASPGPEVKALANNPRVEVTGTVPDIRPFYSDAYAAIVPLLTGGGTRLKILEAMAAGTPVISTRLGAEGLPVKDGREILFADSPKAWIEALEALSNEERRAALVKQARQLVVNQFDWDAIGDNLLRLYKEWSRRDV